MKRRITHQRASPPSLSALLCRSLPPSNNSLNTLFNFYIEELSVRYKGIEVLNFNEIGRRWFTQHGMHLRLPGKRLLAELLLGCLDRFGQSTTIRPPTSPAHAASSCVASSTPLSSLPVQDRQQMSSEALSTRAVQPVEPSGPHA
ncbi:hypothetical protein J6590_086205 [Homalodisca vitripennis]|nr:hypothetical protein J6590_086205 [Homalodisca vitripennis]